MSNSSRLLLAACAAALTTAVASTASAATVFISADQLVTPGYSVSLGGTVDGAAYSQGVYESPDLLTVSFNGGPSQTILAFCVDLFHNFDSHTPPVTYLTSSVQTNSHSPASGGGTALSQVISGEIGYLASLGQTTSDPASLAGIQGAIWQVEYPNLIITGGSSDVAHYVAMANAWGASHPNFAGYANAIYPTNGVNQGFGYTQGFATGGVPEPSTWALMGLGVLGLGAMLRRGRRALAVA